MTDTGKEPTAYERELKAAADELHLPESDWTVEQLATQRLMFLVARARWARGDMSNSNDMLQLMDSITALRKQAKLVEPLAITIRSIDSFKCSHCGKITESETSPATPVRLRRKSHPAPFLGRLKPV